MATKKERKKNKNSIKEPASRPPLTPGLSIHKTCAISVALIGIAVVLCYSNTFNGSFLYDDISFIVENPVVRDMNLKAIWEYNPTRFIVFLSHALNYSFGQYDVFGYHLVNNCIHLLNALLVFWFTGLLLRSPEVQCETGNWKLETGNPLNSRGQRRAKTRNPQPATRNPQPVTWIPLFAGLLFAVHPIQTQSVTYIYQRSSSLTTLFYLLSMTLYLRGRSIPSPLVGEGQGQCC